MKAKAQTGLTGLTAAFVYRDASDRPWNGSAYVTWSDGDLASYKQAATEQGASGRYISDDDGPADWATATLYDAANRAMAEVLADSDLAGDLGLPSADLGARLDAIQERTVRMPDEPASQGKLDDLAARLTEERATKLDNLDEPISSRMATFTYTAAPAAIDVAKATLKLGAGDVQDDEDAAPNSLLGMILLGQRGVVVGNQWRGRKVGAETVFITVTVGTDADALPIVSAS